MRDATADRVRLRLGDDEFDGLAALGASMSRVDLMAWLTGEIVDRLPEVVEPTRSGCSDVPRGSGTASSTSGPRRAPLRSGSEPWAE